MFFLARLSFYFSSIYFSSTYSVAVLSVCGCGQLSAKIWYRKWASSPSYKAPIPFLEMQRKGRAREDGTVIVRESLGSFTLSLGM